MSKNLQMNVEFAKKTIAGFISLILGRQVTIVWGAAAACDANGTIYLPSPKTGEADEVSMLTRQAVHEAGHVTETDFSASEDADANVKSLFNCLEDPRIEAEQMKRFKGASLILNRGLDAVYEGLMDKLDPSNEAVKPEILLVSLLTRGFMKMAPHKAIAERGPVFLDKYEPGLGSTIVDAINSAVAKLPSCHNSVDVMSISQNLWSVLQESKAAEEHAASTEQQSSHPEAGGSEQPGAEPEPAKTPTPPDASAPEASDSPSSTGDATNPEKNEGTDADSSPGDGQTQKPVSGDPGQGSSSESDDKPEETGAAGSTNRGEQAADQSVSDQELSQQPDTAEPQKGDGAGDPQGKGDNLGPSTGDGQAPAGEASSVPQGSEHVPDSPASQSGEPGVPARPTLDFAGLDGLDLGTLLEEAYSKQFGEPDLSGDVTSASQVTVSDDVLNQLIDVALQDARDNGESLEEALVAIAVGMNSIEPGEAQFGPMAAGVGNASGTVIQLDLGIRMSGIASRLVDRKSVV